MPVESAPKPPPLELLEIEVRLDGDPSRGVLLDERRLVRGIVPRFGIVGDLLQWSRPSGRRGRR